MGLDVPDTDCFYDEQKKEWHFTQLEWEEFRRVTRGDGPCNQERLAVRRKAHEDGRWVREALAAKQQKKETVA